MAERNLLTYRPGILVVVVFLLSNFVSSEINIVRGVDLKYQSFYDPSKDFTCINGANTIPFFSVNDDYCDCADGTDEPGTSACPEGRFFCANLGHQSRYLQSSRVNDGICDCCDGSDEYDSSVACFNECEKFGAEAKERQKEALAEANEGYETKKEYIKSGQDRILEKQTRLGTINELLEERRTKLEELRATKETAEAPEKEAKEKHQKEWEELQAKLKEEREIVERNDAFTLLDVDKDGWLSIGELMSHPHLDADMAENDAKDILGGEAMVDADGFNDRWTTLKPKFLKNGRQEPSTDEVSTDSSEGEINTEPVEGSTDEEVAATEEAEKPVEEPPKEGESDEELTKDLSPEELEQYRKMIEERDQLKEQGYPNDDYVPDEDDDDDDDDDDDEDDTPSEAASHTEHEKKDEEMPDYDEATKQLIEAAETARRAFDEIDKEVRDLESQQKEIDEYIKIDFGKDHEFSALKGECYEFTDREYTYKLCPFDKVTQRNKDGGSETDLGRWGKWSGAEDAIYTRMKYEGGQGCWNGPARSTAVHISCGKDNTIYSVSEPSRCEYEMSFKSPALCDKVDHVHTEL